ncbi:MAG: serine protein kinase RIO [Methanomicrobiales archaeon]|nr:serine protein kinase RIO [Methanomicrobiales archaeon]
MVRENTLDRFDKRLEAFGVRVKDADQLKVRQDVFDEATYLALYRLAHKKLITAIGGVISTGKEANIFYGERDAFTLAIKIYLIRTANFKAMTEYIDGDPRFANIRRSRKDLVFAWTRKEYSNLIRAHEAGVPVPEPQGFDRNILLMQFLGEGDLPYPQLRIAKIEEPAAIYRDILEYVETLFREAHLVHGDLSEYNILLGDIPYFIDMGQSVTLDHPRALYFLSRDITQVNRFFRHYCDVIEEKEIFDRITQGMEREP